MTIKGMVQKFLRFWNWILNAMKTVSDFLDRIKWLGVLITFVLGISHIKACQDNDDLQTKIEHLKKACKK